MLEVRDLDDFVSNFDIVDNALDMRTLVRWNGRNLRRKENLAEHTHLVTACMIKLYDNFKYRDITVDNVSYSFDSLVNFESVIRRCMLHDSLEILRGDILSVTKDVIPNLRKYCDNEENTFMKCVKCNTNTIENELVELADLMACYKFIEAELMYPNNDFVKDVYLVTMNKYVKKYEEFCTKYGLSIEKSRIDVDARFKKGYKADAGVDVILDEDVIIMPMSTMSVNLNVKVTPNEGEMGVLCARTSAAARGLCVAMCPIDPHYSGNVTAIVHNVSNQIIVYKKGEAFCQVVMMPINYSIDAEVKKEGVRGDGKLGSTGI